MLEAPARQQVTAILHAGCVRRRLWHAQAGAAIWWAKAEPQRARARQGEGPAVLRWPGQGEGPAFALEQGPRGQPQRPMAATDGATRWRHSSTTMQ